jgi:hypothetical protein
MTTSIQRSDFTFMPSGHGHYKVTYQSPVTRKTWTITTSNMRLIDSIVNSDYEPKKTDLNRLKWDCKNK